MTRGMQDLAADPPAIADFLIVMGRTDRNVFEQIRLRIACRY
jgi:hypothetical protein